MTDAKSKRSSTDSEVSFTENFQSPASVFDKNCVKTVDRAETKDNAPHVKGDVAVTRISRRASFIPLDIVHFLDQIKEVPSNLGTGNQKFTDRAKGLSKMMGSNKLVSYSTSL